MSVTYVSLKGQGQKIAEPLWHIQPSVRIVCLVVYIRIYVALPVNCHQSIIKYSHSINIDTIDSNFPVCTTISFYRIYLMVLVSISRIIVVYKHYMATPIKQN